MENRPAGPIARLTILWQIPEEIGVIDGYGRDRKKHKNVGITVYRSVPLPPNEYERNIAVEMSGMLYPKNRDNLDSICKFVKSFFNVDWSGITIIYRDYQHIVASSGGLVGMHRRSMSMSSYLVSGVTDVLNVPDIQLDDRFTQNSFVESGIIRFYGGATIFDKQGYALGALCVWDKTPRSNFCPENEASLKEFAGLINAA